MRWWVVALLGAAWGLAYMDRINLSVAAPLLARHFHLTPMDLGEVIAAFSLVYPAAQLAGGSLVDRLGPRRMIIFTVLWFSAFGGLTGMASGLGTLLLVRVLLGAGEGADFPALYKASSSWFAGRESGRASSIWMSAMALGPALGAVLTTWLIEAGGWRAPFVAFAALGLLLGLVLIRFLREGPRRHHPWPGTPWPWRRVLSDYNVWAYGLIYFAFNLAFYGFVGWLPSYLVHGRGLPLAQAGLVTSLPYWAGTVGLLAAGFLSDRWGRRALAAVGYGAAAALLFWVAVAPAGLMPWVLAMAGFALYLSFAPLAAFMQEVLPYGYLGRGIGISMFVAQLGSLAGPLLFGYLVQTGGAGGWRDGFGLMVAGLAAAGILTLTLRRGRRPVLVPDGWTAGSAAWPAVRRLPRWVRAPGAGGLTAGGPPVSDGPRWGPGWPRWSGDGKEGDGA